MSMPMPTRRLRWNPAPPPHSPNIIHLPRRPPRENCKPTAEKPHSSATRRSLSPQDEDREFSRAGVVPIVVLNSASCAHKREKAEESWMIQAEMWRAECNFLRMEREFALMKLERNRDLMEATLRSAVQALIAGKKKISEGKNGDANVEQEIEELAEKLEELRRSSKRNGDSGIKRCSKKLSGWGAEKCSRNHQHLSETNSLINNGSRTENNSTHGEFDGRDSEECGSTNSSTANSSAASSASSPNRIEFSNTQKPHQEEVEEEALIRPLQEKKCSGRCKAVVRKIIEHVKAESDQWSQMQEMLARVRDEMQHLQSSRDFWEHRSRQSSCHIQSLHSTVQEWKEKAQSWEAKANEVQKQLSAALEKLRATSQSTVQSKEATIIIKSTQNSPKVSFCKHIEKAKRVPISQLNESHTIHDDDESRERSPQISLAMQIEREKRMLLRRLKENVLEISPRKRCPFRDVANSPNSVLGQGDKMNNNLAGG